MLSEQQIRDALHAGRVLPLGVANPHGPLGLDQLAEAVERARASHPSPSDSHAMSKVRRPLTLPAETWEKLDGLARAATKPGSPPLTASDVAAALLERFVKAG